MYDDTEADFWKEHFSHILHKNMVRVDAKRLTFDNCAGVIQSFRDRHPDIRADVNFCSGYVTFEIFITQTVKLRLFIQNQIKGSLHQYDEGDYVKLVDVKFPYDPFPEIEEFLEHIPLYIEELSQTLEKSVHTKKQLQVAREFIKAALIKAIDCNPQMAEICWNLETQKTDFKLTLKKGSDTKNFVISPLKFPEEIRKIIENLLVF
ncbi:MAG: hypothetical protein MJ169_06810 [Treponema sp.]|nr:hypothetical protein [Treponema sp.]